MYRRWRQRSKALVSGSRRTRVYHPPVDSLLAGCVLLLTLLLILIRPWNLNEAWWAGLGGLATLGLGLASPPQAWGILRDTWDAILLLIGMMALSVVAERAGFFDRVAALA